MIKKLRPYQLFALNTLRKRLKETTHPLLINASVGAGKSLIIAELLLLMERAGYPSLCLTLNSTLIQQNADAYKLQGGNPGIYCAGLKSKNTKELVIFASPHSICKDIKDKNKISRKPFKLIVIDEAHNIDPHNESTMYRRIINHYGFMAQQDRYAFRIVGLTGSPYRGKGISIVGDEEFFKEQVCSISTSWLIEHDYLTPPIFGKAENEIDFSQLRVNNMGKFNGNELQAVIDKNQRLTAQIMQELTQIECRGIFIFASTKKHCHECLKALPPGTAEIITGDTPHDQRKLILQAAREGRIRYLINVNVLTVGVDIPEYDICAWLRPTESLVLYTQGIGRVLRLHPEKKYALILDYAGNLQRHGDIDDPIINKALRQKEENDPDYCIPCFTCNTNNTIHARRCIGVVDNNRCDYYFSFKDCSCGTKNDITARQCRSCEAELIDPNAKLSRTKQESFVLDVFEAKYWISFKGNTSLPIINVRYQCGDKFAYESFYTSSEKAQTIFYVKFIKLHCETSSEWYPHMTNVHKMREMISIPSLKTPYQIECVKDGLGRFKIKKKLFNDSTL